MHAGSETQIQSFHHPWHFRGTGVNQLGTLTTETHLVRRWRRSKKAGEAPDARGERHGSLVKIRLVRFKLSTFPSHRGGGKWCEELGRLSTLVRVRGSRCGWWPCWITSQFGAANSAWQGLHHNCCAGSVFRGEVSSDAIGAIATQKRRLRERSCRAATLYICGGNRWLGSLGQYVSGLRKQASGASDVDHS